MAIYDTIGINYSNLRQADWRISKQIRSALGDLGSVINVGAGAGSYEPMDLEVLAVEPSSEMISQRPWGAAKAVMACAERLPVLDQSFDAALAVLTLHHWSDWKAGLREMRRVARRKIVVLSYFPDLVERAWIEHYFPSAMDRDSGRFLTLAQIEGVLGPCSCEVVPIPHDCTDGFLHAYWRRPSAYLDPRARQGISTFCTIASQDEIKIGLTKLSEELASGQWHKQWGYLLQENSQDLGYRLISWAFDSSSF